MSFVSDYVYNVLENHLIKPSTTLLQKNKIPDALNEHHEEVRALQEVVQEGCIKSQEVLQVIEDHQQQQGNGVLLGQEDELGGSLSSSHHRRLSRGVSPRCWRNSLF